jgi:hypothetical protein
VLDQIELYYSSPVDTDVPWVKFIPAETHEEQLERDTLVKKYGTSSNHTIEYYLLYHFCDEFAIFHWTSMNANGIKTKIVSQEKPFRHTYLLQGIETIVDVLLNRCGVSYPYNLANSEIFDTPHDFYSKIFISENHQQPWEIELLAQLRDLE